MVAEHAATPALPAALRAALAAALHREASDLHLAPEYPPTLRLSGELVALDQPPLSPALLADCVAAVLPPAVFRSAPRDADASLDFADNDARGRFRVSVYRARESWCLCFRRISEQIPTFDWLGFPLPLAQRIAALRNGLVIFTGITGSGKSSTLAALVQLIRQDARRRVLTIEDPVEFLHRPAAGLALISQREVGRDVASFSDGLKYGLRQDPDVILVGEVRDRDTAQMVLSAAETGHLVLTTLHTRDAKGAVTRLVDLFPQDHQDDVRKQLALALRWVVCQHLLPAAVPGARQTLALEVLNNTPAAQATIRNGKLEQLDSVIQTGRKDGMNSLADDLLRLAEQGKISLETARHFGPENAAAPPPRTSNW